MNGELGSEIRYQANLVPDRIICIALKAHAK